MNKLQQALALAAEGFKVFPLAVGAKAPPLVRDWPAQATSDAEKIAEWWVATPNANIGLHCAGMLVIDVDTKKGGHDALALLDLTEGLPPTRVARTPSGGQHWYYRLADGERVGNSVELLGPGLDIRSENGYVVAPGSVVGAGPYAFADSTTAIAPAPRWLVDRLGAPAPRQRDRGIAVADAPADVVERALAWLRTAERSVKGQSGDQAAYRVACRLRDFGLSYRQACDAMRSDAWDFGCGWREGWLEKKPIRSAYRYATGEPGGKVALPEEFPLVENLTREPAPKRDSPLRLAAFATGESRGHGYIVKGLLQRASYAEIVGAPGEGKTFVALNLAYHVAAGRPWMGRRVHAGTVLYLAYEGLGGLRKRAKALRQQYGEADVPLFVSGAGFNLRELAGRRELGALLAALPEKPSLIVLDTFHRALCGGDENSAQDVGAFNAAVAALIESTGACVCIVHHTGKDKSKGARGSSALEGAVDTEILVDEGSVTATKQRDVETGEPIGFKLVPVVVGLDEDDEEETSCIVEPASQKGPGLAAVVGNAKRGFDALCTLSPANDPVPVAAWCDACREFLGDRNVAQRFYDIRRTLERKGYVEVTADGNVTRRMT